jgi:GlcNAc-P-P-Und epimerase
MEPRMTSVVVFGGAGFIGTHLLSRLARRADYADLVSYDVRSPRQAVRGVRYVNGDVRRPIPQNLCGSDDVDIFNLAAVHTTPGHEDWEYYETNVLGALQVCRYATAVGTKRIVFTSSISVYGPSEQALDETAELAAVSAYGRSKCLAETVHQQWQNEHAGERKLTIARPAVIYGPGEGGNFTRLAKLLRAGLFIYPGRRDTIKACGYVEDIVSSFLFMRERTDDVLIYNFCHPTPYNIEQVCSAFCDVAAFKVPSITVPSALIHTAALGFEVISKLGLRTSINRDRVEKLQKSTNIVPRKLMEYGFHHQYDLRTSLARWQQASDNVFV